jgi:hypothetical protein
MAPVVFPKWEEIPPVPGMPHGCLWGFFDKDGEKDQLGSEHYLLNYKYSGILSD